MVDFLAYIMIEFLNEPGIIARAGQAARQYADDKYDWGDIAKQTTEMYNDLING